MVRSSFYMRCLNSNSNDKLLDDGRGKRRRIGEGGDGADIEPSLVELITSVDEAQEGSLDTALEALADRLFDQINVHEDAIINTLSECFLYMPERMPVFSTLAGLLNIKSGQFGENVRFGHMISCC